MFKKEQLWEQIWSCPLQISSRGYLRVQSKSSLLLPVSTECTQQMKDQILGKMNRDEVSTEARNDWLIMAYGIRLFNAVGHDMHTHSYISHKMWELGRMLVKAKEISLLHCL